MGWRDRAVTVDDTDAAAMPPAAPPAAASWRSRAVPDVDASTSLGRGTLQGVTAGFADEIGGAAGALTSKMADVIGGNPYGASLPEYYRQERDAERAKDAAARKANPKTYLGGEFAGGAAQALIPGAQGATVAKLAALGGLQGLGGSKADLTQGDLGGAAQDIAIGAGTGAAVAGAANVLAKPVKMAATAIKDATEGITSPVVDYLENTATAGARRALGYTKRFFKKPADFERANEVAREMMDQGIITNPLTHPGSSGAEDIMQRVEALKDVAGREIGAGIDAIDGRISEMGIDAGVDPTAIKQRVQDLITDGSDGILYGPDKGVVDEIMNTIDAHGEGPLPLRAAQALKNRLKAFSKWNTSMDPATINKASMYRKAYTAVKEAMEDVVDKASQVAGDVEGSSIGRYVRAKDIYGKSKEAIRALTNRLSSESGNNVLSLRGAVMAGGELAAGNPIKAAAVAGGTGVVSKAEGAVQAHLFQGLSDMVQKTPQIFGKYARILQSAAARGSQALGAAHFVMQDNDPEYRQLTRSLADAHAG